MDPCPISSSQACSVRAPLRLRVTPSLNPLYDMQAGSSGADASTLGLATMWDLIVQCPRVRQRCLRVVLDCGVAREEGLRGKAIRLLANKLFPMAVVGQQIEDFARDCLKRATKREVCVAHVKN